MFKNVLPAYSSAKIIKIKQIFLELWPQMYCHVFFMNHSVVILLIASVFRNHRSHRLMCFYCRWWLDICGSVACICKEHESELPWLLQVLRLQRVGGVELLRGARTMLLLRTVSGILIVTWSSSGIFSLCWVECRTLMVTFTLTLDMAALWNRAGHYIFILSFLLSFFFLSFFPRLISAIADWMSTILPHMVWHYCKFSMQVWNVLHAARWKYRMQKSTLFPGPPGWASARRELLDLMVQRKINWSRHQPSGCVPRRPD